MHESLKTLPVQRFSPGLRQMRVLVVDDYPDNVKSLALLLRCYEYEVETAFSGRAAIKLASVNKPDVVLLDISMPGMDGYEVARQLRALFQDQITLIALTANGSDNDRRKSIEAGFDHHLIKPVMFDELEAVIRQAY